MRQKILQAFSDLASSRSYYDIAVSDIARQAGISPSSFYTYYDSKQELLVDFVNRSIERLASIVSSKLQDLSDISTTIRKLIYTLTMLHHDQNLRGFHKILRELEFLDIDIARKSYSHMLKMISDSLRGYGEGAFSDPHIVAIMIIGSSQFIYLFREVLKIPGNRLVDIEVAGDLIIKGLGKHADVKDRPLGAEPVDIHSLATKYGIYDTLTHSDRVRYNILRSALQLLSARSFRKIKIFMITETAGYSVGLFYKVYSNKSELLVDVVRVISKTLRRFLTECTSEATNPVEREVLGTKCFLEFVGKNPQIYAVVREAEHIDPEIAAAYYRPFLQKYTERLQKDGDRIRAFNYESLAMALMGINHMAGMMGPMLKILETDHILEGLRRILPRGVLA